MSKRPRTRFPEVDRWASAAVQGDAEAQYQLGLACDVDAGGPDDPRLAVEWYTKAAVQGHAGAQYELGLSYDCAAGVERDDSQAFRWYLRAAEQGHAPSQMSVAEMYQEGRGVSQDDTKAAAWARKAAASGAPHAQAIVDYYSLALSDAILALPLTGTVAYRLPDYCPEDEDRFGTPQMVSELKKRLASAGIQFGEGAEYGRHLVFYAFETRYNIIVVPEESFGAMRAATELVKALAGLTDFAERLKEKSERYRIFRGVYSLLGGIDETRPEEW